MSQPADTPPVQNAAAKIAAAKEAGRAARAAARKSREIPAPKVPSSAVAPAAPAEAEPILPASLQQGQAPLAGGQEGGTTGALPVEPETANEGAQGEEVRPVEVPAPPAPPAEVPAEVPTQLPIAVTPPAAASAVAVAVPPPAVHAPTVPVLPSAALLAGPAPTRMAPVMVDAFSRSVATVLMSARSTYDRLLGKQRELNDLVAEMRRQGFPEEELQRLAILHRWHIDLPEQLVPEVDGTS